MARPRIYQEPKQRLEVSITQTALKWLEKQKDALDARSISDTVERLARKESN
jgi:hypothetical protein